ncbi:MAG TPA: T9SS type A sorting domain-containing protein [Chitinophagales bacterium]|nr:T9SS type A sorting domain-containing protein [Chitinophagales bacterium]
MKKLYTLILVTTTISFSASSQNLILNGSFENNIAATNVSDLTSNWPIYVSDSWEVDGGSMDLITSDDCGTPSNGNWFVRTSPQSGIWPYLAFSLKLSTALVAGVEYNISFDKKYCGPNSSPIDIGISDDSTLLGTVIHTFDAPLVNSWAPDSYAFLAPSSAKYITVNVGISGGTGQVALDNFVLEYATGIGESSLQPVSVFPNPFSGSITTQNIVSGSDVEIDNLFGASLYRQKASGGNNVISLDFLGPGIYILRINEGRAQRIFKLVKE